MCVYNIVVYKAIQKTIYDEKTFFFQYSPSHNSAKDYHDRVRQSIYVRELSVSIQKRQKKWVLHRRQKSYRRFTFEKVM